MRTVLALSMICLAAACGGPGSRKLSNSSEAASARREVRPNDVIAHMVIENTGPGATQSQRRHNIELRASERTVATELHKFVNPTLAGGGAAGIKCWAMADPQDKGYRIRTLCRGAAETGKPSGLVAEGLIYCPTASGKPNQLELRVSEQGTGDVNPDEQYLPVIRVGCRD